MKTLRLFLVKEGPKGFDGNPIRRWNFLKKILRIQERGRANPSLKVDTAQDRKKGHFTESLMGVPLIRCMVQGGESGNKGKAGLIIDC